MPTQTGVWSPEEAQTGHVFDYRLAQWLGQFFDKDKPLIDMGCGPATYLRYFHDIGFNDLLGVEGTDLPGREFSEVQVLDLTEPIDLPKKGNILCLEVAEHIPKVHMHDFLDNVLKHLSDDGNLVMSWGIPGQAGLGHVNCKHNIEVVNILYQLGLELDLHHSLKARAMVSNYAHWFRDTIMVFHRL